MLPTILYFVCTTIAYLLVIAYEIFYDKLMFRFEYYIEIDQRRLIGNCVGAAILLVDVAVIAYTMNFKSGDYPKILLLGACCVLFVLHILKSLFERLSLRKPFVVVDIIAFFVRLLTCFALLLLVHFFKVGYKALFAYAALAILCRQGARMLDGNWLDIFIEDMEKGYGKKQ